MPQELLPPVWGAPDGSSREDLLQAYVDVSFGVMVEHDVVCDFCNNVCEFLVWFSRCCS